jgi:hypothetical protein
LHSRRFHRELRLGWDIRFVKLFGLPAARQVIGPAYGEAGYSARLRRGRLLGPPTARQVIGYLYEEKK